MELGIDFREIGNRIGFPALGIAVFLACPFVAQSGTWTARAPMPTARSHISAGVVDGNLYVVGGFLGNIVGTVEAYNPATNTWTAKTPMPTARLFPATGTVDGKLFVMGGESNSAFLATLEVYDPKTDSWTTKAPMPTPRSLHAVGVIDGILYAFGGFSPSGISNKVEAYDPKTNTWTTKAPMPTPRAAMVAGVADGILYVVGGAGVTPAASSTVEAYDPKTNTWSTKAPMPTPRGSMGAGVIHDILYVVGGGNDVLGSLPTLEAYHPKTNTWTAEPPMPTARVVLVAGVIANVLYAVGGFVPVTSTETIAVSVNEAFSLTNPGPRITGLEPERAMAGGVGFTLIVRGFDFVPGAVVRWNGSDRPTTFVSNFELRAEIPSSDIAMPTGAQVTVFNPAPGGGVSNTVAFPVLGPPRPPPPQVESLVPASATAGGPAFTLTVRGANFREGAVVLWDSQQRPTTFVSSAQVQAAIPAADIVRAEEARVSVWVPGAGFSSALVFRIEAAAAGQAPPVINAGGLVNAAYSRQPAAAGGIAALYGQALAASSAAAQQLPLPVSLAGVTVRVNGLAARLFSVSPAQINFLMPWELAGQAQATVTVTVNGVTSAPQTVALAAYAPGIFSVSQTGSGQGAVLIANTAALAAPAGAFAGSRPARRGEFVSIYCTGLGPVSNPEASGAPLAGSALSATTTLPVVTIGGVAARVSFAGLAPGWVGLYQVDAEVPAESAVGSAVPVWLSIAGAGSNTVTIAVE